MSVPRVHDAQPRGRPLLVQTHRETRSSLGIADLEGHPEPGAHAATDLDAVDEVDLLGGAQLESGAADAQDGHASTVAAVDEEFLPGTQHVAVERDGRVVVGCLDDQAHLQDPRRSSGRWRS